LDARGADPRHRRDTRGDPAYGRLDLQRGLHRHPGHPGDLDPALLSRLLAARAGRAPAAAHVPRGAADHGRALLGPRRPGRGASVSGGIITAPQPEAVEAGADVLRDGGNAVDAAVACALVQTVVDPTMCGLAGFGTMHLCLPGKGFHGFIDFHGRAPAAATPEMWEDLVIGEAEGGFGFILRGAVNEIGHQSIMTPMTLRALDTALARHGTRRLADLLPPAIAYAEDGFLVRP